MARSSSRAGEQGYRRRREEAKLQPLTAEEAAAAQASVLACQGVLWSAPSHPTAATTDCCVFGLSPACLRRAGIHPKTQTKKKRRQNTTGCSLWQLPSALSRVSSSPVAECSPFPTPLCSPVRKRVASCLWKSKGKAHPHTRNCLRLYGADLKWRQNCQKFKLFG